MTKKTIVLLCFVVLKFELHCVLISPEYDLHRDEYLHLDQAKHLAWGYLSTPPFTSWISWVIKALGSGVFWVKFFPALFGALTMIIVWKAVEELKGNLGAQILAATSILFSVLLRLNILYQPNSMDVLCWTTVYYILIKYVNTSNKKWLYLGAVTLAIGFLNKYNVVFLLIGLFPALLLTSQRQLFLRKDLYVALSLSLVLVLPNLLWQYNNSFPVFHHLKQLTETQLVHVNRFDFLKGQLLFFIGSLFVIISGIIALIVYPPFKPYRYFVWSFLFTLGIFTYLKAKDYYAIGLYPIYLAFGAVYLEKVLQTGWKKYLLPIAVAIPVLVFIPIYQIAFPNKSPQYIFEHAGPYKRLGLLRWEDGKDHSLPQDFADMLGWKELAGKVDAVCKALPANEHAFILCDNYGQAGAINYYSKNKNIEAVTFNADYVNWFNLESSIDHFIRVKEARQTIDELSKTSPYFEFASVADSITNPLARELGTTIFLFSGPKISVRDRLKQEVENRQIPH